MRLDHLQRERGRAGRIEGVAAALQNAHADRGRDPVGRGDDPEGAFDLGTGGERIGSDEIHAEIPAAPGRMRELTTFRRRRKPPGNDGQLCRPCARRSASGKRVRSPR